MLFASATVMATFTTATAGIAPARQDSIAVSANTQKGDSRIINGLITDSNGDPIIGATIRVVGAQGGAVTDMNGRYSIQAADNDELEYSYIGFTTTHRTVKRGDSTINLQMVTESVNLGDVVVVGYGQQRKESVVSSLSSIGAAQLDVKNRSLTNSVGGKIPGLIAVQRSGEPGWDDAQFYIRGISSYAGGTNPLVIVDGVPRSMNNLDTDEIETFTVLKDAAATAVYGAEGANGVVLITTKRGKAQRTVVDASFEYGIATPLRLPKLLDSYDYLSLFNEASWNDAGNPSIFTNPVSDHTLDLYRTNADPDLYPNTDWMDMLRSNNRSQRYTINFRGGGEKVRFFVSGAYYTEDGIYKKNTGANFDSNVNFSRYNLRSNIDFDLSPTTRMSVDMSGQYINRVAPNVTADAIFNGMTLSPVQLIPEIYSDGTPSEFYDSDTQGLRQNPYNFLYFSGYDHSWQATFQTNVTLTQELNFITEGLSAKGMVSFDGQVGQYINRTMSPTSYFATGRDADGNLVFMNRTAGSALSNPSAASMPGYKKIYLEASLNYKHTFNKVHDVTGMILYNQKETQNQNDGGLNLLPFRKQSIVGRATYGYDNRYFVEANFGMTGSENFAAGHRWGLFPSIGGAWFVSHEKWFEPLQPTFSSLKFRASWGITGNDDLGSGYPRFPYLETVNTGAGGANLGISGISNGSAQNWMGNIAEAQAAALSLQWEVERKINFGLDMGFLNGQLNLSVDYFNDRRTDILMQRKTIPTETGLRQGPTQNYGIVANQGVDGEVTFKQNVGQLNLTFRGNFTYAKNKIIQYDEIPHPYAYQDYTGMTIGTPFLYIAERLYKPSDFNITTNAVTGAQSYTLKDGYANPGASVAPGDIMYKDLNQDGQINGYDQTFHNGFASGSPEIMYGLSLNAEYKGWFAGVFFQGDGGVSVNLLAKASNFMPFNQGRDASSARMEALSRWTASDPDNGNVLYPRMHSTLYSYNQYPSTWWYRDASFIRLKNFEFGYQFNKKQLRSLHLSNLRVYVQGENLITWDDVKYWDPELGDANSGAKYPISRRWTMGLEVTF